MTVYIEYVIIDNLVIDYLLLNATVKTMKRRVSRLRVFAAAFMGTAFAVAMPFIKINQIALLAAKLCVGGVMVAVAADYGGIAGFVGAFGVFLAYTFAAGGTMIGLSYMAGTQFDSALGIASLQKLVNMPFGVIVIGVTLVIKFLKKIFCSAIKGKHRGKIERKIKVEDGGDGAELIGIIDTGNALYDGRTGKPVNIVNRRVADKLILNGVFKMRGAHYTSFTTIGGGGKILVFEIDKLMIYCGDKSNIIDNAMIGISPVKLSDNADIILHSKVEEGGG